MKKSIGIVLPFFNTPMWGQTSLWSLLSAVGACEDEFDVQILVVDTTMNEGPRGLKKSYIDSLEPLAELDSRITIVRKGEFSFHGLALDLAVRRFDTDYLLCWETDIVAHNPSCINWLAQFLIDDTAWMAGYEFLDYYRPPFSNRATLSDGGREHPVWYFMPNPGLYKLGLLKEVGAEVQANTDPAHYYGPNYSLVTEVAPINVNSAVDAAVRLARYSYGAFTEERGFKESSSRCPDGKGVFIRKTPHSYENGHWLFYKVLRDYPNLHAVALPQVTTLRNMNGQRVPEHTIFGDGLIGHYWAGTRCWDFLIYPEENLSQINYIQPKIETEIRLWKELVPQSIRRAVVDVINACRNDEYELNNLLAIYYQKLGDVHRQNLSYQTAEWYRREFLDNDFEKLMS